MTMLDQLLKDHGGELIAAITQKSELDASQAEGLLPPALGQITNLLKGGGGGIDPMDLLGGGSGAVSAMLEKLDIAKVANAAGLDQVQAENGLASLIPVVMSLLGDKAGGADGLLSMLGGDGNSGDGLDALGGLAGKLFGK
jgi:hypothetical protein